MRRAMTSMTASIITTWHVRESLPSNQRKFYNCDCLKYFTNILDLSHGCCKIPFLFHWSVFSRNFSHSSHFLHKLPAARFWQNSRTKVDVTKMYTRRCRTMMFFDNKFQNVKKWENSKRQLSKKIRRPHVTFQKLWTAKIRGNLYGNWRWKQKVGPLRNLSQHTSCNWPVSGIEKCIC